MLSVIAGTTDVIGFVGLDGLFTAHITGNLVILAAHVVTGGTASLAAMLSVPVFMAALGLARLLAGGLQARGFASLSPLLSLQLLLLVGFLGLCQITGPQVDPGAAMAIVAAMLGVSAMAVQNAIVRVSLKDAPATAVMTTNITLLAIDVGDLLLARQAGNVLKAQTRAKHTWPAVLGFVVGCAVGAWFEMLIGLRSLILPTVLALLALVLGLATKLDDERAATR